MWYWFHFLRLLVTISRLLKGLIDFDIKISSCPPHSYESVVSYANQWRRGLRTKS